MAKRRVTLDFCKGSYEGKAIYLNFWGTDSGESGYRLAGPKCWGAIKTVQSFELTEAHIDDVVEELVRAQEWLQESDEEE